MTMYNKCRYLYKLMLIIAFDIYVTNFVITFKQKLAYSTEEWYLNGSS